MISHWKNNEVPKVPFYAVIFISKKSENLEGYAEMDGKMMDMASAQEGYLGYSSKGSIEGGIFISYWKDEHSINAWRKDAEHNQAKSLGIQKWYNYYHSMICKVESSRIFERQVNGL